MLSRMETSEPKLIKHRYQFPQQFHTLPQQLQQDIIELLIVNNFVDAKFLYDVWVAGGRQ